jgi:uncharacterized protein
MSGLFSSSRAIEILVALDQAESASMASLARSLDVTPSAAQKALAVLSSSGLVRACRDVGGRVDYSTAVGETDLDGLLNIAVHSLETGRHLFVACRANPGVAFAGRDSAGWLVVMARTATPADGAALSRAIRREPATAVSRFTREEVAERLLDGDASVSHRSRGMAVATGNLERVFADPRRHADPSAPVLGALHPSLRRPSRRAVAEIASTYGLSRLIVFGSAVHDDFRPDSDVDVLVAHRPGVARSLESESALRDRLEELFDRDVDLVEERLAQPAIVHRVSEEGVALYGRS